MTVTPWADGRAHRIAEALPGVEIEFSEYVGQRFLVVSADAAIRTLETLKTEFDFDLLVDLTAVDWPTRPVRFDLIYILYSFKSNERLRVKTHLPDVAAAQSATHLFDAANWLEREVWDMFGIAFEGHPNLKRILLPDEWTGHPLRKDYSILQQDDAWVQANLGIESGQ